MLDATTADFITCSVSLWKTADTASSVPDLTIMLSVGQKHFRIITLLIIKYIRYICNNIQTSPVSVVRQEHSSLQNGKT